MKVKFIPLKKDEKILSILKEILSDQENAVISTWNLKVLGHPQDCASDVISQWFEYLKSFELDVKRKPYARSYLIYSSDGFVADYLDVMWEVLMYWLSFEFPNNPAIIVFSSSLEDHLMWKVLINASALIPCDGLGRLYRHNLQKTFEEAALMVFRKRFEVEDLRFEQLSFLLKKPRKKFEELRFSSRLRVPF